MASQACAHCGEVFEAEGKLVCPHCGADADFTYAEDPGPTDFGSDEDAEYEDFLKREGLKDPSPARRRGCSILLLTTAVPISTLAWLLL